MSRVIIFSRTFPSYHPKAGEPTFFVEKFWKSLWDQDKFTNVANYENIYNEVFPIQFNELENIHNHLPKHHTIRAGSHWKVGDKFSPRVWSGKPYRSPQIVIAPDIEVKNVWNFCHDEYKWVLPQGINIETIAANDGLSTVDFLDWFQLSPGKSFEGQIICWADHITY